MYKIALIAQKGGAGKTSTAQALAVAAVLAGYKTALIDTDPQATASNWSDRRESSMPWVVPTLSARLRQTLEQAQAEGVQFVVIDTPPKAGTEAVEVARLADLVLIPVQPHMNDIETLPVVRDTLKLAGEPQTLVVINRAPVQGRRHEDTRDAILSMGLAVCPVVLFQRAGHADPANMGQTALELDPTGKAAEEQKALFKYTAKLLKSYTPMQNGKDHGKAEPTRNRA